jgi:hypothetical protein
MNQRFLHGLPVTIYRHYGSIHLVGAMAGKARLLPLSSGHDAGEPAGNMSVPRYWRKVLSGAWDKTYAVRGGNAGAAAAEIRYYARISDSDRSPWRIVEELRA